MITQLSGNREWTLTQGDALHTGNADKSTSPAAKTEPPSATEKSSKPPTPKGDSIELSDEARLLSRSASELTRELEARKDEKKQGEEELAAGRAATELASGKYFPPFLGNTRRLEILKYYPQLLKAVEAMIVPAPFDSEAASNGSDPATGGADAAKTASSQKI